MCSMKEWSLTILLSNDIYCYLSLTALVPEAQRQNILVGNKKKAEQK